jgi:hypothetical protein
MTGWVYQLATSHESPKMMEMRKARKPKSKKAETGTPTPLHHFGRRENSRGFLSPLLFIELFKMGGGHPSTSQPGQ